jgi:hypothetical protein
MWDWWHMGNYASYAAMMDDIFIFEHALSLEVWLYIVIYFLCLAYLTVFNKEHGWMI